MIKKAIIGMICLNFVLAGALVFAWTRQPGALEKPGIASAAAVLDSQTGTPEVKSRVRPAIRSVEPATGWQALASSDLQRFVANLRSVGCPEQTLRDIVLAEVNRRYDPLAHGLKVQAEHILPWEAVASRDRKNDESKWRQLLDEKRALLKDVLGLDVPMEVPGQLAGRNIERFESAYKGLPSEKRDQVRAIQENYWSQSDAIKERTIGFLEPEDREEFVRIKAERRAQLAEILTPHELESYELATSTTGNYLRSKMNGFEAKDEELRALLNFTQPLEEEFSLSRKSPDPENKEFTALRKEAEQAVENQIKTTLGDERYAEYQRMQDSVYRDLAKVGKEVGLAKDSIVQVYEVQKALRSDAERIMRDTAVPPELRIQALQEMQARALGTYQSLLGNQNPEILGRLGVNSIIDPSLAKRYGLTAGDKRGPAPSAKVNVPGGAP